MAHNPPWWSTRTYRDMAMRYEQLCTYRLQQALTYRRLRIRGPLVVFASLAMAGAAYYSTVTLRPMIEAMHVLAVLNMSQR